MKWLTPGILFLLYLNAPAVAVRIHGAPFLFAALVPLALAIPVAHRVLIRGESVRFPNLLLAAFAMLLLHSISALISIRPDEAMDSLQTWLLEGVLLALLISNAVRSRGDVKRAAIAIVAAGAVMGGLAIGQQLLGAPDENFYGFAQLDATISDASGATTATSGRPNRGGRIASRRSWLC